MEGGGRSGREGLLPAALGRHEVERRASREGDGRSGRDSPVGVGQLFEVESPLPGREVGRNEGKLGGRSAGRGGRGEGGGGSEEEGGGVQGSPEGRAHESHERRRVGFQFSEN